MAFSCLLNRLSSIMNCIDPAAIAPAKAPISAVINGFSNIDLEDPAKILPFRVMLRAIGSSLIPPPELPPSFLFGLFLAWWYSLR